MLNLNNQQADRLAMEGLQRAENHAEAVTPCWSERADQMFIEWLKGWPRGYKFLIEDFRRSAEIRGLPEPPSKRAFGGIPLRAKKQGLIKSVGLKATKSPDQHRCFATQWEKI